MAALNFDATQVAPADDFTPIPAGDYTAMIIDSGMEQTKTGRGSFLKLTLQIIDGPLSGRLLWDRLTLVHDNTKTVEIAQRQLSAICHALGIMQVQDSAQLHGKPMLLRVKYIEGDGQYGPKNEIGAYKAIGSAPTKPAPTAPAQPKPWQNAGAPSFAPAATPVQQTAHAAPPPPKAGPVAPPWLAGKAA